MQNYQKNEKKRCRVCGKVLPNTRVRFCGERCQVKLIKTQVYPSQELYRKHEHQETCS